MYHIARKNDLETTMPAKVGMKELMGGIIHNGEATWIDYPCYFSLVLRIQRSFSS